MLIVLKTTVIVSPGLTLMVVSEYCSESFPVRLTMRGDWADKTDVARAVARVNDAITLNM